MSFPDDLDDMNIMAWANAKIAELQEMIAVLKAENARLQQSTSLPEHLLTG